MEKSALFSRRTLSLEREDLRFQVEDLEKGNTTQPQGTSSPSLGGSLRYHAFAFTILG